MQKIFKIKSFINIFYLVAVISIAAWTVSFTTASASVKGTNVSKNAVKKALKKAMTKNKNKATKLYRPYKEDFDGDRKNEFAFWNDKNGVWLIFHYENYYRKEIQWGLPGDIPFVGDFDYDGRVEIAVYRPSTDNCHLSLYNESWPSKGERIIPRCFNYITPY